MKKILTIGGATKDIYLHYEGTDCMTIKQKKADSKYILLKSGAKIEVENILSFSGGGATNSAVSFKRQGFDVCCFCKIGNDESGNFIKKELEKENIDYSKIITTDTHTTGTSFVINTLERERTIFAYRGANGHLSENELPCEIINNSDQIYITSLSHESSKLLPKIVEIAHKNKIPVAINPGISQLAKGEETLKKSLNFINTLIMNSDEAKSFMIALIESDETYKTILKSSRTKKDILVDNNPALLQSPLLHEDYVFSIRKFFKEVLKMGPKIVVITDGENGVYVAHKNKIMFHPSIKTKVVDTLGAGDSFGSCFVGSIAAGKTIEESLIRGIINSSSVISKIGAKPGLLNNKELDANKINFDLIQEFNLD